MDTMAAFARGAAARGNPQMVFDWDAAARIIRDRKPAVASAGLASDWEWTGGEIYRDGAPVPQDDTYVFLASTWAEPELDIDGEVEECYLAKADVPAEWGNGYAEIYWPASALAILNGDAP